MPSTRSTNDLDPERGHLTFVLTMRSVTRSFRTSAVAVLVSLSLSAFSGPGDCKTIPVMNVVCMKSSALLQVQVDNCKKIGKMVLEIADANGRVLYREEGKAMTGELVRRLDKGILPRGTHTLTISTKDFVLSKPFTVE